MARALLAFQCATSGPYTMQHSLQISAALAAVLTFSGLASAQQAFDLNGADTMLGRINALRVAEGLAPLERSADLDQAAQVHSADMARRGELSHVSPSTGTPADRVRETGVSATMIAENVAMHRDVDSAFQALVQSDAHRANMLSPDVTHLGVSALRTPDGVYVTQVFAILAAPEPPPPPPPSREVIQTAPVPARQPAPVVVPPVQPAPPVAVQPAAPAAPPVAAVPRQLPGTPGATLTVQDGSQGIVVVQRHPQSQEIEGYWVYGSARWWYYPRPAGVQAGAQLQPDLSVAGPPPGFPEHPHGPPPAPAPQAQPQAYQAAPMATAGGNTVVIQAGQPFYAVPPPPLVGRPSRAWLRVHRRWERAHRRWLRQQRRQAIRQQRRARRL